MIRIKFTGLLVAMVIAAAWVLPAGAGSSSGTVIVMPARTRVVQLAFQVASVKDVWLVAYNNNPALSEPLIHFWNGHEWKQIDREAYLAGSFLPAVATHVFLLGDSTSLPVFMTWDPTWAKHVHKTADLNVASLLNTFGPVLKFSASDWRWLADENDLTLNDRNAERRHHGRWSQPGTETPAPVPMPDIKDMTMPPATPAPKSEATQESTTSAAVPVPPAVKVPDAPKASTETQEAVKAPVAVPAPTPDAAAAPATKAPDVNVPSTNAPGPAVSDPASK